MMNQVGSFAFFDRNFACGIRCDVADSQADTFRRSFVDVAGGRRGQPLSVEAGMRILRRGGNAVDAGVRRSWRHP